MAIDWSDILIDFMGDLHNTTNIDAMVVGSVAKYTPFNTLKPLDHLIFSAKTGTSDASLVAQQLGLPVSDAVLYSNNSDSSTVGTIIDNTQQIKQNIFSVSKNNDILDKEQIYKLISTLTVDELSLFSPKIDIYRRLPASLTTNAESANQGGFNNYIYKKFDFVDGWSQFSSGFTVANAASSLGLPVSDAISNYYNNENFNTSILNGSSGYGVAAIMDASWEVHGSTTGLQTGPEIYDYLNKIGASISSFEISFKFDSINTFFGNAQGNEQLITDFMVNPKAHLQEMIDRGIEGNETTRNYAYLMFFSDIDVKKNASNQLEAANEEAYRFIISVGYNPIDADITEIIKDPEKQSRITQFNTLLKQYPDYFNLTFKAFLSNYQFEFAKDSSVKLTSKFGGVVQQGIVNELFAHKRNEYNFMKCLEKQILNVDSKAQSDLQTASKEIEKNQNLLVEYEAIRRTACLDDAEKAEYDQFAETLKATIKQQSQTIQSIKQKSLQILMDGMNFHLLKIRNDDITKPADAAEWSNSITDETGISANFISDVISGSIDRNVVGLITTPFDVVKKFERFDGRVTDLKSKAAGSDRNPIEADEIANKGIGGLQSNISTTNVPFFFFGELVNNILDIFKANTTSDYHDIYCTMPNITVYQRTIKLKLPSTDILNFGGTSRIYNTNAAWVPISLDLWRRWSYKNITVKNRTYYHLFDLLNDLRSLLTEAINYKTQEIIDKEPVLIALNGQPFKYSSYYQTSFDIETSKSIWYDLISTNQINFHSPNGRGSSFSPIATGRVFKNLNSSALSTVSSQGGKKNVILCGYTDEIMFKTEEILNNLYATTDSDGADKPTTYITSAGEFIKDMKLGIVHFYVGNQLGLAKEITFKQDTAPKQAEQQATSDSNQIKQNLKSISYNDVEIKLIGGNFFRPTETIYVHPHWTFGSPFSPTLTMSNIMNIGGYYSIIKVNSSFTSTGKYETTLTAKFLVQAQKTINASTSCGELEGQFKDRFDDWKYNLGRGESAYAEEEADET